MRIQDPDPDPQYKQCGSTTLRKSSHACKVQYVNKICRQQWIFLTIKALGFEFRSKWSSNADVEHSVHVYCLPVVMSKDTFSVMFMWVTVHPPAPIFFGGMGDAAVDGGRSAARRLAASWRQASSMQWRAGCQASLTRWSSARRSSPSFRPTTRRARLNQLWCSPAAPLLPTVDWLNFRPEQWVPTAWNFVWDPLVQNSRLLYSIQKCDDYGSTGTGTR